MKLLDRGLAEKGLTGEKEKSANPKKVESTFQSMLPFLPNYFDRHSFSLLLIGQLKAARLVLLWANDKRGTF